MHERRIQQPYTAPCACHQGCQLCHMPACHLLGVAHAKIRMIGLASDDVTGPDATCLTVYAGLGCLARCLGQGQHAAAQGARARTRRCFKASIAQAATAKARRRGAPGRPSDEVGAAEEWTPQRRLSSAERIVARPSRRCMQWAAAQAVSWGKREETAGAGHKKRMGKRYCSRRAHLGPVRLSLAPAGS